MFRWDEPTTIMVGAWETWTDKDTAKFRELHKQTGQVAIYVHNYKEWHEISQVIDGKLTDAGFSWQDDFIVENMPNINDVWVK